MSYSYIVTIYQKETDGDPIGPSEQCICGQRSHYLDKRDDAHMAAYFCRFTLQQALAKDCPSYMGTAIYKVMPDSTLKYMFRQDIREDKKQQEEEELLKKMREQVGASAQRSLINIIKH
jgi:hypothetical protein